MTAEVAEPPPDDGQLRGARKLLIVLVSLLVAVSFVGLRLNVAEALRVGPFSWTFERASAASHVLVFAILYALYRYEHCWLLLPTSYRSDNLRKLDHAIMVGLSGASLLGLYAKLVIEDLQDGWAVGAFGAGISVVFVMDFIRRVKATPWSPRRRRVTQLALGLLVIGFLVLPPIARSIPYLDWISIAIIPLAAAGYGQLRVIAHQRDSDLLARQESA